MTYTAPNLIQAQLRSETPFGPSTVPTLTQVNTWISEIKDIIDNKTGQEWDERVIVKEFDYSGLETIRLKDAPIASITKVEYRKYPLGSESPVEWEEKVEDKDYTVYLEKGEISFLPSWNPATGRKRIRITATVGYDPIPPRIQELATKMVAIQVIESVLYQDVDTSTDANITVGAVSVVSPSHVGINKFTQLRTDVDQLFKDIVGSGVVRYDYT